MSKIIYDRSGKAHVIGGKGKSSEAENESAKPARGAGAKRGGRSESRGEGRSENRGDSRGGDRERSAGGRGGFSGGQGGGRSEGRAGGSGGEGRSEGGGGRGGYGKKYTGPGRDFNAGGPKKPKGTIGGRRIETEEKDDRKYPSRRTIKNEAKGAVGSDGRPVESKHGGRYRADRVIETRSHEGRSDANRTKGRTDYSDKKGFKNKQSGSRDKFGKKGRDAKGGDKFAGGKRGSGYQPPREAKPRSKREPDPSWNRLKAIVDKNKRGTAFLVFDNRQIEDVFVPRYYLEQLFHGDRVEVYTNDDGEIEDLRVLEHRFKIIFGKVHLQKPSRDRYEKSLTRDRKGNRENRSLDSSGNRSGYLIYERKKAKEEVYIPELPEDVKAGDWVKAELNFEEGQAASATVTEVIGQELPAIYDIQMVAGEFNLNEHHTFDAVKQAESYRLEIPGKDEEGRTDLRGLPFITIDGERARDFDDAVYVEDLGAQGYRLWVAIADVSHYVKLKTALDDEAYARATSVYFPERAFHMLPRALSEELCSLKPNVPRMSMACSIDYSKEGEKGEIKIYNAIIESRRRSTYTEIAAEKENPKHATMFALYRMLKAQRHARGSIDFDFPEAEIILDEKTGEPSDIVVRERNDAHRLIEEFMIAANEAVSEWMLARKLPFIYRTHQEPSAEAIGKFIKLAKTMGVNLLNTEGGVPRPRVLAQFIATLKGHAAEPVLATALLRSMRQAMYTATHGEHYGLASDAYTHFTSPIRRYPDLIVHRLLRAALAREEAGIPHPTGEEQDKEQLMLEEMAEHCSYRERVATDAERESIRFKQIRLMAKHVGEEFDGKVNGLTERGMFIQLWSPYCEGMVPTDSMRDDWYDFIEEKMMLIGKRKRKQFQIGTPVRIRVVKVDFDARTIEFELLNSESKKEKESWE